jgi:hypothetical protein
MQGQEDGVKAFWRDEAKLSILSRQQRLRPLVKALGIVLLVGTAVFIGGPHAGMERAQAALIGLAISCLVVPLLFVHEMYHKGGEAGAKLRSELDAKIAWRRATRDDVIPIFHELATRAFVVSPSDIGMWFDEAVHRVRQCLKETYADEVLVPLQKMFNGDYGHRNDPIARSRAAHATCCIWLSQWEDKLENHHVNADFLVPT